MPWCARFFPAKYYCFARLPVCVAVGKYKDRDCVKKSGMFFSEIRIGRYENGIYEYKTLIFFHETLIFFNEIPIFFHGILIFFNENRR